MINKRRSQLQPRRWTAAPPVCGSSIYRQRPTGLLQTTIGMSRLLHQSSRDGFPHGNKIRRWIAVEYYSKASNRTFLKLIRPWRIVLRKDIETGDEKGHVPFRQHGTDWGRSTGWRGLLALTACAMRCVVSLTVCAMHPLQSPTPPQRMRPFDAQINHKSPIWSAE
jgi:hypothetical protein